jgi:hypothetical protein
MRDSSGLCGPRHYPASLASDEGCVRIKHHARLKACHDAWEQAVFCSGSTVTTLLPGSLKINPWGQWHWPLVTSTPEREILEVIDDIPKHISFDRVDKFLEGLLILRPRQMQSLLEETRSIKVKRLFFYFADRHRAQWLDRIDRAKIDLGKGKRMIAKGGKLDPKYQITVPEEMDALQ